MLLIYIVGARVVYIMHLYILTILSMCVQEDGSVT